MLIYKRDREVELGSTKKNELQVSTVRAVLELATSGFQVQRPNHPATLYRNIRFATSIKIVPTCSSVVLCL